MTETLGRLSKAIPTATILVYIIGFIVLNMHLSSYGIYHFKIVSSDFLKVGLLFILIFMPLFYLLHFTLKFIDNWARVNNVIKLEDDTNIWRLPYWFYKHILIITSFFVYIAIISLLSGIWDLIIQLFPPLLLTIFFIVALFFLSYRYSKSKQDWNLLGIIGIFYFCFFLGIIKIGLMGDMIGEMCIVFIVIVTIIDTMKRFKVFYFSNEEIEKYNDLISADNLEKDKKTKFIFQKTLAVNPNEANAVKSMLFNLAVGYVIFIPFLFGAFVYHKIPFSIGGGKEVIKSLAIKKDKIQEIKSLGLISLDSILTPDLRVVFENENKYYINFDSITIALNKDLFVAEISKRDKKIFKSFDDLSNEWFMLSPKYREHMNETEKMVTNMDSMMNEIMKGAQKEMADSLLNNLDSIQLDSIRNELILKQNNSN